MPTMLPEYIFHVLTKTAWEEAQKKGEYSAPSLATEGFIHCSCKHQVAGVLERYYKNQKDLVFLKIDPKLVKNKLQWDKAKNGEEFPHIYGPLNLEAVVEVHIGPVMDS